MLFVEGSSNVSPLTPQLSSPDSFKAYERHPFSRNAEHTVSRVTVENARLTRVIGANCTIISARNIRKGILMAFLSTFLPTAAPQRPWWRAGVLLNIARERERERELWRDEKMRARSLFPRERASTLHGINSFCNLSPIFVYTSRPFASNLPTSAFRAAVVIRAGNYHRNSPLFDETPHTLAPPRAFRHRTDD